MVTTQKKMRRQAFNLSAAAFAFTLGGAVAIAAPFAIAPRAAVAGVTNASMSTLMPLGAGTAIQLTRATTGEAEDCVRVTRMTGPDGKVYATRGLVCGGE